MPEGRSRDKRGQDELTEPAHRKCSRAFGVMEVRIGIPKCPFGRILRKIMLIQDGQQWIIDHPIRGIQGVIQIPIGFQQVVTMGPTEQFCRLLMPQV